MKKTLLAAVATALALTATAQADIIVLGGQNWTFSGADNLTLTPVVPGGNQPLNIQCVICGDNQPQQQADFGYTNFKNNGSDINLPFFSTNVAGGGNPGPDTVGTPYDGSFLRAYLLAKGDPNLTFSIGVDVNDNNTPQILESFFLLNFSTHTVLAAYRGGAPVLSQNNGTGFPDYTLGSFNIALGTDIHAGDQLAFFARISNASDGPDSFFLVPTPLAVPGPVVGAGLPGLLVGGLLLLGLGNKRRRSQTISA